MGPRLTSSCGRVGPAELTGLCQPRLTHVRAPLGRTDERVERGRQPVGIARTKQRACGTDHFRKRALVNGGGLVDAGFGATNLLTADDFTEMTARLHLVGEGFVQTIFRMGELLAQNEAEKRIYRLAAQEGLGSGELSEIMDRQIALIFDGVSAKRA